MEGSSRKEQGNQMDQGQKVHVKGIERGSEGYAAPFMSILMGPG